MVNFYDNPDLPDILKPEPRKTPWDKVGPQLLEACKAAILLHALNKPQSELTIHERHTIDALRNAIASAENIQPHKGTKK